MKGKGCNQPGCNRISRALGPECTPCRARLMGWLKAPVYRVRERVRKLTLYTSTMRMVTREREIDE